MVLFLLFFFSFPREEKRGRVTARTLSVGVRVGHGKENLFLFPCRCCRCRCLVVEVGQDGIAKRLQLGICVFHQGSSCKIEGFVDTQIQLAMQIDRECEREKWKIKMEDLKMLKSSFSSLLQYLLCHCVSPLKLLS